MRPSIARRSAAVAVALVLGSALSLPAASAAPCAPPAQALARLQKLADAELEDLYLACALVSSERRLSLDEAVGCSVSADVLKARVFKGDFHAQLAWWQANRDRHAATDPQGAKAMATVAQLHCMPTQ
jgi:hypothetical protein